LNEESSFLLEEELPFLFLLFAFALSFLFSAVSFSSYLMRSSKAGTVEAPDIEPSSLLVGLPSSQTSEGLHLQPRSSTSPLQAVKLFSREYAADTN
jgi:hypothetical protein